MKKLLLLLFCSASALSQEPVVYWGGSFGGFAYDSSQAANIDPSGNLYLTGGFASTADFDMGAGSYPMTSLGQSAGFLVKYNSNRQIQWGARYTGDYFTFGFGVDFDSTGNVYEMGTFDATVDFNPGSGVFNMSAAISPYVTSDIFMTRLDTNGNFNFAKQISSSLVKDPSGFVTDAAGNMYLTGYFNDVTQFSPTVSLTPTNGVLNSNIYDIFIAKYTNTGTLVWVKQIGHGSISQRTEDIRLDSSGNVLVCGQFHETTDFDPSPTATFMMSPVNQGVMDIFVIKLDPNGNFVWAKSMGGTASNTANAIRQDTAGNLYLTGYFSGTIDFDPGSGIQSVTTAPGTGFNGFVLKLDASGNFSWVKQLVGNSLGNALVIDANGDVVVAGQYNNTCDFSGGAGTAIRPTAGQDDAFLAAYGSDGTYKWVKCFGGTQNDKGVDVKVDTTGNYYLFGDFYGTASLHDSVGSLSLTSNGSQDVFIIKLGSALGSDSFDADAFTISPNPVRETLYLQYTENFSDTSLAIYTIDGRLVHQSALTDVLDVAGFAAGAYILSVSSEGKSFYRKFVKE